MLRHIISVSLAMTACAILIPTKANAAIFSLVLDPMDTLKKNSGESITFLLKANPNSSGGIDGVTITKITLLKDFDSNELKNPQVTNQYFKSFSDARTAAKFVFDVVQPKKDGNGDVSTAQVEYLLKSGNSSGRPVVDFVSNGTLDVQPVPEPLTIFGTATALGCGALFKRKSSKKTVS